MCIDSGALCPVVWELIDPRNQWDTTALDHRCWGQCSIINEEVRSEWYLITGIYIQQAVV